MTAFIGLDWADAKHDFCLQPVDSDAREFGTFAHQRHPDKPVEQRCQEGNVLNQIGDRMLESIVSLRNGPRDLRARLMG